MTMRIEVLAVVTVVFTGIAAMRSSIPDLLVEKDDGVNDLQSNNIPSILGNSLEGLSGGCVMEIQYTKRINGKCTKLGKGVEGCVAGSYIHPFHSDCLFAR